MNPYFFDGAYGTYFWSQKPLNEPPECLNITEPSMVRSAHNAYLESGCNALKTNTFGANHHLGLSEAELLCVLTAGYTLAKECAAPYNAHVFCDIGPIRDGDEEEYFNIIDHFCSLGADHFLFETFASSEEVIPLVERVFSRCAKAVVIVSFAVNADGYSKEGIYYKTLLREVRTRTKAQIVGLNCLCGPAHMLQLFEKLAPFEHAYLAMPNAGYPDLVGERSVFECSPAYFADVMAHIHSLGLAAVGGCCGTTPAHMRSLYTRLQSSAKGPAFVREVSSPSEQANLPLRENPFETKLLSPQKAIAMELDPPKQADMSALKDYCRRALALGVDLITLADNPLARSRADSVMSAIALSRLFPVSFMPHLACRDRNDLSIRSILLSAGIEGLQNILAVTGDPIPATLRGESKGVFSFQSFSLLRFIAGLNEELFASSPFFLSAALNSNAANFEAELSRCEKKLRCGAKAFFTQPIYNEQGIENIRLAKKHLGAPIMAGIMPIASYKNALFLKNEVSGIRLEDSLVERYRDKTREECAAISFELSKAYVDALWAEADGYYLMMPLDRFDLVESVASYIKTKETLS